MANKINDTAEFPNVAPADGDFLIGTDVSNTANDVNGETATFTMLGIKDYVTEVPINAQIGTTYTLVLSDRAVTMSNASANTLTIPTNAAVAFSTGVVITVIMLGAGVTTVEGDTGVTINGVSAGSCTLAQYGSVSLLKIGTDAWNLQGATVS